MTRRTLTVVLFCFAVAIAQAKPNFSGTWKLNVTTSDFGQNTKESRKTNCVVAAVARKLVSAASRLVSTHAREAPPPQRASP